MRFILVLMCMMIPTSIFAKDKYVENARPDWNTDTTINKVVKVKSQISLTKKQIELIRKTYRNAESKFFEYWKIDRRECSSDVVEVRIITEYELDNRTYFPGEDDYTDASGTVIGRYFRHSNVLYIVPPYPAKYYWRKDFAHELAHYFYDDCGIKFLSDYNEHIAIREFLNKHKRLFY